MKVFLTAGFDRALHVVALAELLRRDGHSVAGVLVVKALQWSRLKQRIAQQGLSSVKKAARRMLPSKQVAREPDAMQQFLEEESITHRSLSAWTSEHNVPQWSVASLNSTEAILKIEEARADLVAYGGGGILKGKFIDAARGLVLNAHSGPLPEIRGMNACEWSLLLGPSVAVTIHGIDRGIDTGPILERIPISVDVRDTIDALRSKCTVAGVRGILRAVGEFTGELPPPRGNAEVSRQCFVMAPAIREILERRLARGCVPIAASSSESEGGDS